MILLILEHVAVSIMLTTSVWQGQSDVLLPFEAVAGYNMKTVSFSIRDMSMTRFGLQ